MSVRRAVSFLTPSSSRVCFVAAGAPARRHFRTKTLLHHTLGKSLQSGYLPVSLLLSRSLLCIRVTIGSRLPYGWTYVEQVTTSRHMRCTNTLQWIKLFSTMRIPRQVGTLMPFVSAFEKGTIRCVLPSRCIGGERFFFMHDLQLRSTACLPAA